MFALLNTWDASQNPPLGQDMYAYQSTMEVYDEAGKLHKLTIYFDRISNANDASPPAKQNIGNSSPGESYWEYIITMDPTEDMRDFASDWDPSGNAATNPNVPASLKGLLGAGTITFNSSGEMKDMTCFVPHALPNANPTPTSTQDKWWDPTTGKIDIARWVPAPFSTDGFPMIAPNFSGTAGQQMAYYDGSQDVLPGQKFDYSNPNRFAAGRMIAIDFGLKNKDRTWHFPQAGTLLPDGDPIKYNATPLPFVNYPANTPRASDLLNNIWQKGTDPSGNTYTAPSKLLWNGLDGSGQVQATRTTNLGDNFYEQPGKKQDGYTYGDLRYVNVSTDGVLSATYSNGVSLQLYQITLYDFPSEQNLRREGGNLFTETRESGLAGSGAAGTGTFGTTQGYSLEQSNVDLSREFVNMITTQRGFQANSTCITTVDTMLETVISMKR
jgi:flagellar hook protein FlgE